MHQFVRNNHRLSNDGMRHNSSSPEHSSGISRLVLGLPSKVQTGRLQPTFETRKKGFISFITNMLSRSICPSPGTFPTSLPPSHRAVPRLAGPHSPGPRSPARGLERYPQRADPRESDRCSAIRKQSMSRNPLVRSAGNRATSLSFEGGFPWSRCCTTRCLHLPLFSVRLV